MATTLPEIYSDPNVGPIITLQSQDATFSASLLITNTGQLTFSGSSTALTTVTSSYSQTASFVTLAQTASLANSVTFSNINGKPTLISSSLQFKSTDNVTFGNITSSIVSSSTFIGDGSNVTGVISSSHSNNSDTASFVQNAISSSYALSSSYSISSSYSVTSSNASSVQFSNVTGKPTLISSSLQFKNTDDVRFRNLTASIISASTFIGDGSNVTGVISASNAISSSYVLSSSYAVTSSYTINSTKLDIQTFSTYSILTTTSTTFVDLTSTTLTTNNLSESGNYIVNFAGTFSAPNNTQVVSVAILINGIMQSGSINSISTGTPGGGGSNPTSESLFSIAGSGSVSNGQIIKVQWKTSTGTATCFTRALSMVGVPGSRSV